MKRILLGIAILLLISCSAIPTDTYITFTEVSQPYLDHYGQPEEVATYTSSDYATIEWWWLTKGLGVKFVNTTGDLVYGWAVESTSGFEPIP